MDLEKARSILGEYVKVEFGKIVQLRDVYVTRHSTGRIFLGDLYIITKAGDIKVGEIGIDTKGKLKKTISVDKIIEELAWVAGAYKGEDTASLPPESPDDNDFSVEDDFSDLSVSDEDNFADEDAGEDELNSFFPELEETDILEEVKKLLESGQHDNLLKARQMLPRLLMNPEQRGHILLKMGELEIYLKNRSLGLNYLEAAVREFSDFGLVSLLKTAAKKVFYIVGKKEFETHPVKKIIENFEAKMRPITKLNQIKIFKDLGDEEIFEIEGAGQAITAGKGNILLKEGEKAVSVYAIRSGILSVFLDSPDSGQKHVRSLFPGCLVGESSVLGEEGATCNATVIADCLSELWLFDGKTLKQLSDDLPELKRRFELTKQVHQLDSFFSINEKTSDLGSHIRESLLSCMNGFVEINAGEVLFESGKIPDVVYLLSSGIINVETSGKVVRVYKDNSFIGLTDALHELVLEGKFIAETSCKLIRFKADEVKELAANSSPEVVAVLERLE